MKKEYKAIKDFWYRGEFITYGSRFPLSINDEELKQLIDNKLIN